jgi:predicted GIY-YIG superfamily endonuclease/transposase
MYIGITNNPDRRLKQHLKYSKRKKHYNGNWIRKTIENNGEIKMFVIMESLSKETAIKMEISLIDFFQKTFPGRLTNTAKGGLGFNHKGVPHSEKHKKALSKAQPHKVRIPKEILYDLYVNQKLSKKKIADIYECGTTTIDRRLIEYNIPIRRTPNYKISYKLDREKILDMYLNKRMSISEISNKLGIGTSGIRYLLQREEVNTGLNRFTNKCDIKKIKQRYNKLIQLYKSKMIVYEMISTEFGLSTTHIYRIIKK